MIFVHLIFWLFIIIFIYILIKYHEYINAIIIFIGGLFIEKLHLTNVLFNNSTYRVFINYFYWLLKSNSLVTIVGLLIAISTISTLMAMFKQWIKIGVLITILYWLGS
ncbi:unnamed protein product [Rotaria sordida]|uniref:Uncharacterized protein n=1 Tax=Rotaria sordida TaxID=392033 RepID=A0A813ZZA1_9BILA|nr:unnamed protein product [Rotaria sordida]CAF1078800.1 unnamed protein product [Rotaria sordida]CAF1236395.1 unnamed protein product [Rotaria sordida]CAF1239889.1 unnamed protein product [Rotaria sordida]